MSDCRPQGIAWTLHFGPSPIGLAWVVAQEGGVGQITVCEPEAYEEARHIIVRRALADDVEAVQLVLMLEEGKARILRQVLDR